ncbi:MAG: putative transporter, permease protein [Rhodospirillales bacterium]|nr:putative transporter, permease protein [Rhodospirillales bacterium]
MLKSISRKPKAQKPDIGTFETEVDGDRLLLTLVGRWDVPTVMANQPALQKFAENLAVEAAKHSVIDLSSVTRLDTVGAIAVSVLRERMARFGTAEITGAHEAQEALLDQIAKVDAQPIPRLPIPTARDRIANLGKWAVDIGHETRELVGFFGELCVVLFRLARHPGRIRLTSIVNHMQQVGIDAMPIVGLLAFLIGVVLTFISGDQLQRFGASVFIVNLIGIGVLRELGILITAIIVAGRSGSAFTAEIGTMKINQEVDAMRTIGLDPMEILVIPRVIALIVMLIPLGFFADIVEIAGGALMASISLNVTFTQFVNQFHAAVSLQHLWVGMVKAPFFAFVIAMVGCFHGMAVSGSAESVGQQTTASVVQSIFLVITLDAIFAVVSSQIGW